MKALSYLFFSLLILGTSNNFAQKIERQSFDSSFENSTRNFDRYYYFPNLGAYYDTYKKMYIFKQNNEWITAKKLPPNYGGYSLYKNARVLLTDYGGETPYSLIKIHKKLYPYSSRGNFDYSTSSR